MTTSSVGTGQTYSTPQAWFDDAPATLIADWIGQCIIEEFATVDAPLIIAGTTLSGFALRLETATGASFKDVIGSSGPLAYNQSGAYARLRATGSFAQGCFYTQVGGAEARGLQLATTHANNSLGSFRTASAAGSVARDCIIAKEADGNEVVSLGWDAKLVNCLIEAQGDSIGVGNANFNISSIHNCTIVCSDSVTSTTAGVSQNGTSSNMTIKNSLVFGFQDFFFVNSSSITASDCTTDDAATAQPTGTNLTYSITYDTSMFEALSPADYRVAVAGDGDGTGTRDQTETSDLDIYGSARDTTTPDQGAYEISSAPAAIDVTPGFGATQESSQGPVAFGDITAGASITTESSEAATVGTPIGLTVSQSLSQEISPTVTVTTPVTLTLGASISTESGLSSISVGTVAINLTAGPSISQETQPAPTIDTPAYSIALPPAITDETPPAATIGTPVTLTLGVGSTTESSEPATVQVSLDIVAGASISTESSQAATVDTPAIDLTLGFGGSQESGTANISVGTAPVNIVPGSSPTTESSQPATVGTPVSLTLGASSSVESGLSTVTVGDAQVIIPGAGVSQETQPAPTVGTPITLTLGVSSSTEGAGAQLISIGGGGPPLSRTVIVERENRGIAA